MLYVCMYILYIFSSCVWTLWVVETSEVIVGAWYTHIHAPGDSVCVSNPFVYILNVQCNSFGVV